MSLTNFVLDHEKQTYRVHREALLKSYVPSMGEEPNGKRWTGFQCVGTGDEEGSGHVLVFRERENEEPYKTMRLPYPGSGNYGFTELRTGSTFDASIESVADVAFQCEKPGEFLFYRYEGRS